MFLTYLDESGNTGSRLDDPDQPVHWLVAVLVPEEQVLPLAAAVDAVVAAHVPQDPRRELHGAELFGGDKRWRGVPPGTRLEVYEEALRLLQAHGCAVAHASVDKRRLAARHLRPHPPHLLALQFLVEKLDGYLAYQRDPLRQRALLVADETNEHEAFALDMVKGLQATGAGVVAGRQLRHIVDTVHFVRSETNRGVQLADLAAYGLARAERVRDSMSAGNVALVRLVDEYVLPQVRTYRMRWP
ncbi:DUF3800 domain-containing protein [Cellulomonas marina]|uniref:DUF3800 domain-containing protein n=1 Tax=Cellulomonas marina TaxID=988821 RepID=A0A1I0X7Q0_9CELL|nr:DUF3800 domain-containing protein [Cellulomonas marina]GIG29496.1 hypothetical protein Cma02nite_20960 [Cellulomonas marina]SFA97035.1 Protein of unknown function [Cellulomonas marina]